MRTGAGRAYTRDDLQPTRDVDFDPRMWHPGMACRRPNVHPDLFHPADGEHFASRRAQLRVDLAKRVCRTCPFVEACADWADTHPGEAGQAVYGATTGSERGTRRSRRGGQVAA